MARRGRATGRRPSPSSSGFSARGSASLLLFGWSVALFYHLCNGIRHLWWDTGRGLELKSVYASGWTVVAATAALTLVAWIVGLGAGVYDDGDAPQMRSPLGRVLGLGSAKEGVEHWWAQRVTAIALVPLALWFVIARDRA